MVENDRGKRGYIQKGHAQLPTKKSWCSIILLFRISTWSAAGERKNNKERVRSYRERYIYIVIKVILIRYIYILTALPKRLPLVCCREKTFYSLNFLM